MINIKPLKEFVTFIRTGKTPPTKEKKYFDGDIKWYSPGDLDKTKLLNDSKRTITQLAISDKKAVTFPKNTLLIGCIGDIGKLGITTELSSSNQQLTGVLPNNETDVNYLFYWFLGNKKVLESYSNNAVVPILNNRTLETVKIPLPPLEEQKKIAAILDAAHTYMQKTKTLTSKYNDLTQSLFLDMFGDLRVNKKNFEKNILEEYLEFITYGLTVRPTYINNGIRLISAREIKTGRLNLISGPQISESDFKKLSEKGKPKKGEILFSKTGSIGHSAIIDTDEKFAITQNAARLVFKESVLPIFALEQLRTSYFQSLCQQRAKGNAVKDLQLGEMKKLPFVLPPIKLQNQFAERVKIIETQKSQAEASLAQAENLFNSLLQRAFKGELTK